MVSKFLYHNLSILSNCGNAVLAFNMVNVTVISAFISVWFKKSIICASEITYSWILSLFQLLHFHTNYLYSFHTRSPCFSTCHNFHIPNEYSVNDTSIGHIFIQVYELCMLESVANILKWVLEEPRTDQGNFSLRMTDHQEIHIFGSLVKLQESQKLPEGELSQ